MKTRKLKVRDLMTEEVRSLSMEDTALVAWDLMEEKHIRHVPVVEDGRPVGMVSARDALGPELETFVYEMLRQEQVGDILA